MRSLHCTLWDPKKKKSARCGHARTAMGEKVDLTAMDEKVELPSLRDHEQNCTFTYLFDWPRSQPRFSEPSHCWNGRWEVGTRLVSGHLSLFNKYNWVGLYLCFEHCISPVSITRTMKSLTALLVWRWAMFIPRAATFRYVPICSFVMFSIFHCNMVFSLYCKTVYSW